MGGQRKRAWQGEGKSLHVVGPLSSMATPPHPHPPPLTALSPATPIMLLSRLPYTVYTAYSSILYPTSPSLTHKYTDLCSPLWNDPVAVGYKPPGSMQSEQVRQFPHLVSKKKKTFVLLSQKEIVRWRLEILLLSLMLKKKSFWRNVGKKKKAEGAPGFEPGPSRSAVECSTTELYPHTVWLTRNWLFMVGHVCVRVCSAWRRQIYMHRGSRFFLHLMSIERSTVYPAKRRGQNGRTSMNIIKSYEYLHVKILSSGFINHAHTFLPPAHEQVFTWRNCNILRANVQLEGISGKKSAAVFWPNEVFLSIIMWSSLLTCLPPPHHQSTFPHQPPPTAASLHETRRHANRQPHPGPAVHAQQVQR